MDNLNRIFNIAFECIGMGDDGTIEDKLESVGSSNIKNLPSLLSSKILMPAPVIPDSIVERYIIFIDGSNSSFIDIHKRDATLFYIKIFFLFNFHQIFKKGKVPY